MSALPPKADTVECNRHVRFVPKADISVRWVEAKGRISVSPLHLFAKTKFTTQWGHTPPSCGTAQCAQLHLLAKVLRLCRARSVQQHIH